jgi:tetraacyldisaccharide 4'-kinase
LLDVLYAQAAGARRRWFERHPEARRSLRRPVISVGNLSVGGTGKTPLVSRIAKWLIDQGERPAILSRGYKRRDRVDGVVVVSDGAAVRASLDQSGDEPLMLARQLPKAVVCVSEDRYLAGVLAERELGATVHVLDDGFQHVQLARDFDILVTRPGEVTQGRVLPFGRLRESRDAAARADLVVIVDGDLDAARAEAWELGISQFAAARRVPGAASATGATDLTAVIAVAGIGMPERFFEMLRQAGFNVVRTIAFPDHHRYLAKDIARIASDIRAAGAAEVVTTEKDAVRFERLGALPFVLRAVPMTLHVEPWDAVTAGIEQALARARGVT